MNTNLKGNIGEAKALQYFISEGYEVYLPFGTASKCDLIVLKNNITKRISVKTTTSKTSSGKYRVKIRQSKLNEDKPFDKNSSDILFIYVLPEDRVVILNSMEIDKISEITI